MSKKYVTEAEVQKKALMDTRKIAYRFWSRMSEADKSKYPIEELANEAWLYFALHKEKDLQYAKRYYRWGVIAFLRKVHVLKKNRYGQDVKTPQTEIVYNTEIVEYNEPAEPCREMAKKEAEIEVREILNAAKLSYSDRTLLNQVFWKNKRFADIARTTKWRAQDAKKQLTLILWLCRKAAA